MKIYQSINVYDAAIERIRRIFNEFENVVVNFSGGKDSTICLNLAIIVAKELGRLPVNVIFLDQEAEWEVNITYVRKVMNMPEVNPYWLQVPFRLFNASSNTEQWLNCWGVGETWIRDKENNSIHDNVFGTDRFADMLSKAKDKIFKGQSYAAIGGVRCEESPARYLGLTSFATYKDITWGLKENPKKKQYMFYPIYDWSYTDVWKAIHDNGWDYCGLYDLMYQYGIDTMKMRVSSVIHETALKSLFFMQEVEPDTWRKITARISGINTVMTLKDDFFTPKELPYMFKDWKEYRDHLLENLITDEHARDNIKKLIAQSEVWFDVSIHEKLIKHHIKMILRNDFHDGAMDTFAAANGRYMVRGTHPSKANRNE